MNEVPNLPHGAVAFDDRVKMNCRHLLNLKKINVVKIQQYIHFSEILEYWLKITDDAVALDLRSTGRGFNSYSGQKLRNNLGQVVHTYVPLSPSSSKMYCFELGT